jgi:putative ABC transport system permease protein
MLFWTIFKVGMKSLLANKLRSFLAMLGIIIGVGAVISMMAIGAGAQRDILARLSALGTNLLVVRPGQTSGQGVRSGTAQTLTPADAEAIVAEVPGIGKVAPVVSGSAQLKCLNRNTRCSVVGSSVTYLPIRGFEVEKGRAFTEAEVESRAHVILLGPVTAQDLFGQNDPLGSLVKVNAVNFRVVGVMKSKGDQGWFNPDDQAIVPYTVAMKELYGRDYLSEIDVIAADESELSKIQEGLTALLHKRHRIQGVQEDDFQTRNQAEMIQTRMESVRTFSILLGCVAFASLLVGGIGIMNIMLVTVTERTREIGVRKAIGAKERSILLQFLIESVIISAVGGLVGSIGGVLFAKFIEWWSKSFTTQIDPSSIVLSLSVAGAVGIFFGAYPAWRAARLDPVEALRYE